MDQGVAVLRKTIKLMNYIANNDKASGISELSKELDMPKATVHRILNTLCEDNVILKTEEGLYRLGPTVLLWSNGFHLASGIAEMAQPYMRQLRDESKETVHLSVYEHGCAQYADRLNSPQTVVLRWSRLGSALPLYCTAAGRAILAALPQAELDAYLAGAEMTPRTKLTVTSPDRLREMLARFRNQGYAEENQENEENIRCIGAAILNRKNYPVAAISLTAPSFRFTDYDAAIFGAKVAAAARDMSSRL